MLHIEKGPAFLALLGGAFCLAGTATAQPQEPAGRTGKALAYEQIALGQLRTAERTLEAQGARDARDPGRLINLAVVYGRTGRIAEARAAFGAAMGAPEEMLVVADGRSVSSRDLAREGLDWLDTVGR